MTEEQAGEGRLESVAVLPDGSGAAVVSFPLPKDHWLYSGPDFNGPPMPFRMGIMDPRRPRWELGITLAARYAVRCATINGTEEDFDPDALVQNFITGMLGYYTPSGLTGMAEDRHLFDPDPPPVFVDGPYRPDAQLL